MRVRVSVLLLAVIVFFFGVHFAFAEDIDYTTSLSNTDFETVCFLTLPTGWNQTEITYQVLYPGDTGPSFTGGPDHTCANGYEYDVTNQFTDGDGVYYINNYDVTIGTGDNYYGAVLVEGANASPLIATSTGTRILNVNEPDTDFNTVTASTTVDFDIDYVSNSPVPDEICIEINNLSSFQNLNSLCEPVTQSGILNYATSTVLVDGDQYQWRVVIRDSNNSIIDLSEWYYFTVVTPPYTPYDPGTSGFPFGSIPAGTTSTSTLSGLTLECDPNDGFFGRSVCNLAVLLFVPSQASLSQLDQSLGLLAQRLPFSAYIQFKTAWNDAVTTPTTSDSTLSLTFYGQETEIISTTSLALVSGENSLDTIRYVIAIGLWIAFGYFAFTRVTTFF